MNCCNDAGHCTRGPDCPLGQTTCPADKAALQAAQGAGNNVAHHPTFWIDKATHIANLDKEQRALERLAAIVIMVVFLSMVAVCLPMVTGGPLGVTLGELWADFAIAVKPWLMAFARGLAQGLPS